ncbi:MAG: hypothetical protein KDD43_14125, partial [Bdellovibrionales bacterium]|nr:hypothetical protein [Bdellovibrionales bacterium]
MQQCQSGAVLARAKMFNVLKLLNAIGPDFRTTGYMAKKAEIAQLLAFGKLVGEMSMNEKRAFEDTNPSSTSNAATYYGRIERPFKKRYVESKMRTLAGQFPEDPNSIPASVAGLDEAYTHGELAAGATTTTAAAKSLEIQGSCAACGWQVNGRHSSERTAGASVITSRAGGQRFSYPEDPQPLCPIIDDVVGIEGNDGKFYAYRLGYEWIWERLKPVIWGSGHVVLAQSRADAVAGKFRNTTYKHTFLLDRVGLPLARLEAQTLVRVSQPYGKTYAGRGHCRAFRLNNVPRDDNQFSAPAGQSHNYTRYLTGLSESVLLNECRKAMPDPVVITTVLDRNSTDVVQRTRSVEVLNDLIVFTAAIDGDPVRNTILNGLTSETTQLGSNYWVFGAKNSQGQPVSVNYGVGNMSLSPASPFYASHQSHGDVLIRHV